ncbi:MAG: hypothetical protein KC502_01605 [Myxococcales bacterium]|nr:hypothetical protein [Myxococcales bacterium]
MARSKRRRGFYRPAMAAGQPLGQDGASSEQLWQLGESLEEQFDYEAAQQHYREAVRRSSASDGRDWLTQYASFLVERYGQFPEVAAWLDDAEFKPLDGADLRDGLILPRLVLSAALESGHQRAAKLDEAMAHDHGEPASVGRVSEKLLVAGQQDAARQLLERYEPRLPAFSRAVDLLAQLRLEEDAACEVALARVQLALDEYDAEGARAALELTRAQWSEHARFKAAEAHVASAELRRSSEQLRAQIEQCLDTEDIESAVVAAQSLCALNPDSEGDKSTLAALMRQAAARDLEGALGKAAHADGLERLRILIEVRAQHGEDTVVPPVLSGQWALIGEAFAVLPVDIIRADSLMTVVGLRAALTSGDVAALRAGLGALHGPWKATETAQAAANLIAKADRAAAQQADAACETAVRKHLQSDDLQAAGRLLDARGKDPGADGALLKNLRKELQEVKLRIQQRSRLKMQITDALQAGELFTARRALATLECVDEAGERISDQYREAVDERCLKELRATPVPPFNLSVDKTAIACTVAGGRLLLVQNRLWLSVNLASRGLAPFQLPEGFPLDQTPAPQLGARDGTARLIGTSKGRLITIEQHEGQPPEVTNARPLAELTRGATHVVSWALEPDGDTLALVVQGKGGAPVLVRIDADTLDAVAHDRVKPSLAGVTGIRGAPETLIATTTPEVRMKRGWALGRFGESAHPEKTWSQDEVEEPIAAIRRAIAWPEKERIFASYDTFDMFDVSQVHRNPSLFVLRGDRIVFASSDLRKRFAPMERIVVDHAWTLDPTAGRLWFAALPRQDHGGEDAMLLGVNAEKLRADPPVVLEGVARILAINATDQGAAALCRTHSGKHAVAHARVGDRNEISLTIDHLPV